MPKELELWQFVAERLRRDQPVMLLVVAESSGSSPGRAGYKMAVAADGELCGSIGGGLMEVNLVERARALLSDPSDDRTSKIFEQIHRKNAEHPSGMICSGEQTVILKRLSPPFLPVVLRSRDKDARLAITTDGFVIGPPGEGESRTPSVLFTSISADDFIYREQLHRANDLCIIGGGHCALALSELMSNMDFRISIFDDRPELNTIEKNEFADEITIIDSYDRIGELVPDGAHVYVVVMTLGYPSDEVVIRGLFDKNFRYFGVLGSKAKMATLMKTLRAEGYDPERLDRIRTPIGLQINSRTPEEIAVSIAAEIISVKNAV